MYLLSQWDVHFPYLSDVFFVMSHFCKIPRADIFHVFHFGPQLYSNNRSNFGPKFIRIFVHEVFNLSNTLIYLFEEVLVCQIYSNICTDPFSNTRSSLLWGRIFHQDSSTPCRKRLCRSYHSWFLGSWRLSSLGWQLTETVPSAFPPLQCTVWLSWLVILRFQSHIREISYWFWCLCWFLSLVQKQPVRIQR